MLTHNLGDIHVKEFYGLNKSQLFQTFLLIDLLICISSLGVGLYFGANPFYLPLLLVVMALVIAPLMMFQLSFLGSFDKFYTRAIEEKKGEIKRLNAKVFVSYELFESRTYERLIIGSAVLAAALLLVGIQITQPIGAKKIQALAERLKQDNK